MHLDINRNDNGVLTIGGIAAGKLVATTPTPCFAYDFGAIAANFNCYQSALQTALPAQPVTIHYACKANNNLSLMRFLKNLGAGVDVVSGGELEKALAAGFTASDIVYSGVGKTTDELIRAITLGIHQINAESSGEVARIANLAAQLGKRATVAVRVNPDVDAKTHAKITTGKKDNKFGVPFGVAKELFAQYHNYPHINLVGLTMHIGSQLLDLNPFENAYTRLAALVHALRDAGHTVTRLDLGGGVGIAYHPHDHVPDMHTYAKIIADTVGGLGCALAIEPGRSIVGNAGYLLAQIIEIKKTDTANYLVLDAAMNDLMRPAMYDAYHHIVPLQLDPARAQTSYDIVGPICESGDTFVKHHAMQDMQVGEYVVLCSAGAYGTSMSSTYNLRPLPAEIACENGVSRVIRRAQPLANIWMDEI